MTPQHRNPSIPMLEYCQLKSVFTITLLTFAKR